MHSSWGERFSVYVERNVQATQCLLEAVSRVRSKYVVLASSSSAFTLFLLVLLTRRRLTDGQTGMRALSREAATMAEIIHDYNYAQVLTLHPLPKGCNFKEVPIRYRLREHGKSFISWRYPVRVLPAIWRESGAPERLTPLSTS